MAGGELGADVDEELPEPLFVGFGALELSNTVVNNNHAGYGGGIDMSPSGGHADLRLDAGTLIIENTALESGGGIRIEGDTRLYVLAPQTHIKLNHALNGYGGGIEVLTPAHADIGSPGYNGTAVVQINDAVNRRISEVLAKHALPDHANVVTEVLATCGLDSGKYDHLNNSA